MRLAALAIAGLASGCVPAMGPTGPLTLQQEAEAFVAASAAAAVYVSTCERQGIAFRGGSGPALRDVFVADMRTRGHDDAAIDAALLAVDYRAAAERGRRDMIAEGVNSQAGVATLCPAAREEIAAGTRVGRLMVDAR